MSAHATVTITANGKAIPVTGHRYGAHRWRTQMGLTPVAVTWTLPNADAALVLAAKEVSITFTPATGLGDPFTWQRVVVVSEGPSDDPEARMVTFSDVRWYLLRVHAILSYNRRVFSGTGFINSSDLSSFVVNPAVAQVTYALPTLRNDGSANPSAWTAKQMIDDVCARLTRLVGQSGAPGLLIFRDLSSLTSRGKWNPSDVVLDAPGNVALGQALGSVGGVDARVAPDGAIELVDAMLGAEKTIIQAACTSSLANGAGLGARPKGVMRWCVQNHCAPTAFLVQYTREMEVRADSWEQASVPATPASQYASDAPWAEPVLRVADLILSVNQPGATPANYTAVQSTVVPVDAWFAAVAAKADATNAPPGYAAITRSIVQQNYLADVLTKLYADSPIDPLGPSTIWTARLGAITSDYRNLFRLNPRFARRCVPGTIVASRAALLNPATGERQKSPVYRDYYTKPTTRGLVNQQRLGNQVTSIPPLGGQTFPAGGRSYSDTSFPDQPFPLAQAQYAPFELSVADAVNGYFRLAPRQLPGTEISSFVPSLITQAPGVDTYDMEKGGEIPYLEFCQLIASDRVTWIFSAVPVGPNGEAQVQTYVVDYVTALSRLGVGADAVTAQGPKTTIRIGDGVQRARVAWNDALRAQILGAFMSGQGDPTQLVPVNDAALLDYAISSSAVYMATQLDHYEGTQEIAFSPTIGPVGSLQIVEHVVTATAELYTELHATHATPMLNPLSFMSQSSRNAIFGNLGGSLPA